jgi:cytochrome c-type biogenesis protein CcmH/NrfG
MKKIITLIPILIFFSRIQAQDINTGREHYYYKRYLSAENFFHGYLRQQPGSAEGWLWLVKSYARQGKFQSLRDTLSKAPSSIQDDPDYLVAKGIQALVNKARDSAMMYFTEAIDKTKGKNTAIMMSIAQSQFYDGEPDKEYGLELLQKAIKRDKNNSSLYLAMGNIFLARHDGTEAYKAYKNALEKDGSNAEAYYQMGQIFLSQKNPDVYLDYFKKAIAADDKYAPAWYELYNHYRYKEPATALNYFRKYADLSDYTINHDYAYTDLLYLNKNYTNAISRAGDLLRKKGSNVQPRIHKLIAYSYAELKDTANAITHMQNYFGSENDTNFIAKDFETMADLFASRPGMEDSIILYFKKAINIVADSSEKRKYYQELANLSNERQDYKAEAEWRGKYYSGNKDARNIDLFNWGLASYRAGSYKQADSVFGLYTAKYPDQGFGYYWRARSNAAIDTALIEGLAIPHYEKLIAIISDDTATATNKKWLLEAYSYLAAWETNTEKDYKEAIGYFGKILEIDPGNNSAKKYIEILEQNLKKEETAN